MLACVGIYVIQCIVTGKVYVGSSLNCRIRCKDHVRLLELFRHSNRYLQNAWKKHGAEKFVFKILEVCDAEAVLLEREQFWIDKLHAADAKFGYNCANPIKQRVPSKRMTAAHKTYWGSLTDEEKKERLLHIKTQEFQDKATAAKRQSGHRQVKSEKAKAQWQNPDYDDKRKELRARFKGFHNDPIVLGKISAKAKKRWEGQEYRERGLKQINEASLKAAAILLANPVKYAERMQLLADGRVKATLAIKARWADPEFRARRIAQMKLPRKRRHKRTKPKLKV